jgi:hypothetical protein
MLYTITQRNWAILEMLKCGYCLQYVEIRGINDTVESYFDKFSIS